MGERGRAAAAAALGVAAATLALGAACAEAGTTPVTLAATTSTHDAGLLDTLVAAFGRERPGYRLRPVVSGSGQALALGRRGDADVLLVHAPEAEEAFMEAGHGLERVPLMYNDFVLVGPPEDPAGVREAGSAAEAMARVARARAPFLSRGDDSGTHLAERALWAEAEVAPQGAWYLQSGQGQGETLQMADQRGAYALTDRATYRVLERGLRLAVLYEDDPALLGNLYSVIVATRARRLEAARELADWLSAEETRHRIAAFGRERYGTSLFHPLVIGTHLPLPAGRPEAAAPGASDGTPDGGPDGAAGAPGGAP